jgi:outer membrane protein OmpA-like peptidoglycan-associated protein
MRRAVLTISLLSASLMPTIGKAAEIKDHPAVNRYPGSTPTRRDEDGFKNYTLVVGVSDKGRTDEEILKSLEVEGQVTRLAYENAAGRSAHEIFTNYLEGLRKGGFEILFSCVEKQCGPSHASSRWGRVTGMKYFAPDMRYLAAKSAKGPRDVYVSLLVAKRRHQLEVVEAKGMQTGLVTANAISEGLLLEGRSVLDGIYFDTDLATIKLESKAALAVIARYLKDNPSLNAFIVGHTDGAGTLEHNMALSRDRAAAVVAALTPW